MPARNTLGDHSAAVPFNASTCRKPSAAALRRMVPTLPASCSRSSTTESAPVSMRGCVGSASSKPICAGDSRPDTVLNSAGETTSTFGAASASARSASSAAATSVISASAGRTPRCTAARARWSPSSHTPPSLR